MTIAELQKMTPAINGRLFCRYWFYKIVTFHQQNKSVANNLSENNVSAWKEYMKWTLLNGSTGLLSTTVDAANFDFTEETLTSNQTKDHLKKSFANG
jgi:endothelin-converting enzyme/putative endopeptidase